MPASDLKTGTFVFILNLTLQKGISKKLQPDRKGPNQITEKFRDVTYKLLDHNKNETVKHRNNFYLSILRSTLSAK